MRKGVLPVMPPHQAVIPAKAGIQCRREVDSLLRGNDDSGGNGGSRTSQKKGPPRRAFIELLADQAVALSLTLLAASVKSGILSKFRYW